MVRKRILYAAVKLLLFASAPDKVDAACDGNEALTQSPSVPAPDGGGFNYVWPKKTAGNLDIWDTWVLDQNSGVKDCFRKPLVLSAATGYTDTEWTSINPAGDDIGTGILNPHVAGSTMWATMPANIGAPG